MQAQQQQRRGTTPVLQQSHMQLSLGMGLGLTLDLGSWCYGTSGQAAQANAPGGVQGGGGTPRASAATHRRRAGTPVEDYPPDKVTPPGTLGWTAVMSDKTTAPHSAQILTLVQRQSTLLFIKHYTALLMTSGGSSQRENLYFAGKLSTHPNRRLVMGGTVEGERLRVCNILLLQEHAQQQQPSGMPGWPLPAGVAAALLQNVRSNHLGTALTVADLLGLPAKVPINHQTLSGRPSAYGAPPCAFCESVLLGSS